jgi:tRNA pseudouridine13 synthase
VRSTLARRWGDWEACARELPRSSERSLVTYLRAHPAGFAHAFELLDTAFRLLLVNAYQSYLWNRALARWIEREFPFQRRCLRRIEHWDWPFPVDVSPAEADAWRGRALPLPAPKMEGGERAIVEEVLRDEGLDPRRLRFKRLRKTFFGRGLRPAWLAPRALAVEPPAADELNPRRLALAFSCELPKGAYATLLTRRLLGTWKRGRPVSSYRTPARPSAGA